MTTPAAPTSAPRLALPEPPYEPALQALLERLNPPGAPTLLALFRLLALHPPLAERLRGWGGFLLGPGAALGERERLLVRLVDELHEGCDVGDVLWAELAAVWSPAQLIELLLLAGGYRAIAGLCRATRLPLEARASRFATLA